MLLYLIYCSVQKRVYFVAKTCHAIETIISSNPNGFSKYFTAAKFEMN